MNTTSSSPLHRRQLLAAAVAGWALGLGVPALATDMEPPEALIERVAGEVFSLVKADPAMQAGDMTKVLQLVDTKLMPYVNFNRMTASAVGRFWRQASTEQRSRLQAEFKTLLVRTYSGALGQLRDQKLVLKPSRYAPEDKEVVVRSELRGSGDPIQLDYRMEKTANGWRVYDINVLGVWLVDTYRGQFAQEINARGIDGLIATLTERNRSNASANGASRS